MYAFTQRLFPVPYEWGRLGLIVGAAALIGAGELLLPTDGAVGLLSRAALWLSYPLVLWGARFLSPRSARRWPACCGRRRSPPGCASCAQPRRRRRSPASVAAAHA